MEKTSVSIVNVTSYTGLELIRLLSQHPVFKISSVTGRSAVGKSLRDVFPQLQDSSGTLEIVEEPGDSELAFVCLPHAAAAESVIALLKRGIKVVDLSADFRLRDAVIYQEWYKHEHPAPELLKTAVYGLCERYRKEIVEAQLVANPGCHASAAILALLPALSEGFIEPAPIIDSKTGISGAGRGAKLESLYAEVNEDTSAYGLGGHRHLPEIVQELDAGAIVGGHRIKEPSRVTFVPHLVPMTRGILATCYADLRIELSTEDVQEKYREYYKSEAFIHIVEEPPHTKWSYGSNHVFIYPSVDIRTKRLIVVVGLDNLIKGASGQAIQNGNLMMGLPEASGLISRGIYP